MKKTRHGDYELPIRFPVFRGFTIHVVISESLEKSLAKRYGPKTSQDLDHAAAYTLGAESSDVHMFFRIDRLFLYPAATAGDLAHESWHAVRQMFKFVGIGKGTGCEWPDNEAVAYHIGFTVERATKFFQEVKDDHRKEYEAKSKRKQSGSGSKRRS